MIGEEVGEWQIWVGGGSIVENRERGIVWQWSRIEFGPFQGLSGNWNDYSKCWANSDGPNGVWVVLRTVGTAYSLGGGFLCTLREWISGFHDWLRQRPSSLFMSLGYSSISLASLINWSMYLDLMDRILVSWRWIRCPQLMLCSATADLSGWARRMCRWFSLILVLMKRPVCPM
jgi:hypothetical protein